MSECSPLNLYASVPFLCARAHETAGAARTPAPPRPLFSGGTTRLQDSGEKRAAGIIFVVPDKRAKRALIRDPYAAAEFVWIRWWTALLKQPRPVVMGPGLRRGDA